MFICTHKHTNPHTVVFLLYGHLISEQMCAFPPFTADYSPASHRLLSYSVHLLRDYLFIRFVTATNGHKTPVVYNNKDLFLAHVTCQLEAVMTQLFSIQLSS